AVAALLAGTLLSTIHWGAFPPRAATDAFVKYHLGRPTPADARRASDVSDLLAMIPAESTYGVSDPEIAHASTRLGVRALRTTLEVDYVLFAVNASGSDTANAAIGRGEYVEVARRTSLVLAKGK